MSYVIEAEGLAKKYRGGVWGIREVSFKAPNSSLTVLLGPNGAGKTTTVKVLSTLLKPTKGRAYVLGMDVVKEASKLRSRIAICPQDVRADPNWTPMDAVVGYLMCRGWSLSDARKEARKWIEELELWSVKDRPIAKLSGGQAKRVVVAMVLASNADMYFLDEPTAGLDVEGRFRVWRVLRNVIREDASILLTTHDMKEAELLADYVVMIHEGKVIASGSVRELVSKVPYVAKVVVRGVTINELSGLLTFDLGDKVIAYVKSKTEALSIASMVSGEVSISGITLEDAYIYLIRRGGGSE